MITTLVVSKLGILMQGHPISTILLYLMMISGLLNYNTDDTISAELCDFHKLILYIPFT
jgi:hypothetical protein